MWYTSIFPFKYFVYTRLLSWATRISFLIFYVVPVILLFLSFSKTVDFNNIFCFFIAYVIVNYIYETGYIQNDTQTVKLEKNATNRLEKFEEKFIDDSFFFIVIMRLAICLALTLLLFYMKNDVFNFYFFFVLIVVEGIVFFIYNNVRSNLNFYLIFILSYIKSFSAVLPFIQDDILVVSVALVFFQPLPKLIEFTREEKYKNVIIPRLCLSVDIFRVLYFSILTVSFCILNWITESFIDLLCLSFYFLISRSLAYILSKISNRISNDINKNTKKSFRS